jgi:hypothetical protein
VLLGLLNKTSHIMYKHSCNPERVIKEFSDCKNLM